MPPRYFSLDGIGISPPRRCRSIATACSANSFHCFAKSKYICRMSGPGAARAAHWHSTVILRQASAFAVAHSFHSVAFANELNRPCPPAPVCLTQCPVPSESDRSTAPRKMTRCATSRHSQTLSPDRPMQHVGMNFDPSFDRDESHTKKLTSASQLYRTLPLLAANHRIPRRELDIFVPAPPAAPRL